MIVVDIETTGMNPEKHSILSIGAVDFEHPKNTFYEECRIWEGAHIDPEALKINGFTETQAKDLKKQTETELVRHFLDWVKGREEQTLAGQNPQFDTAFIRLAAHRGHLDIQVAHRSIDQHTIVFFHMIRHGIKPPIDHKHSALNSDVIMKYVGIPTEPRPHNALNGATWETEAMYRLMYDKPYLPQFSSHQIPWLKKA